MRQWQWHTGAGSGFIEPPAAVGEGAGNCPVSSVNIDMLTEDPLPATRSPRNPTYA
jgi:hypothetical protein